MAGLFRQGGVNFDDLFDPDVTGDGPSVPNLRAGGTPLKYAALSYGSKRADVGYRVGGSDVSNLWAAKGTAQYVTDGGLPGSLVKSEVGGSGGVTSSVEFVYRRNGTAAWAGDTSGSGSWAPGGGTPGDLYDIRYSLVSGSGGTLTGVTGVWQQVNADRYVALQVTAVGGASRTAARTISIEIRRRSDSVLLVSRQVQLYVDAISDGGGQINNPA